MWFSNVLLNVFFKSLNTAYTDAAIPQILPRINVWDENWKWTPKLSKSALKMTAQVSEMRQLDYNEWIKSRILHSNKEYLSDWDPFGSQLSFLCTNMGVTSVKLFN